MGTWTVWDAVGLVGRSWRWMAFVTTPATLVAVSGWWALADGSVDVLGVVVTGLLVAVVAGLVAIGGGIVAVPCTYVLGRLLVRRRSHRGVHVVAHALLAGTLAALCTLALFAWWVHAWTSPAPVFLLLPAASAGAAAAIGAWRRTARPRTAAGASGAPGVDTVA